MGIYIKFNHYYFRTRGVNEFNELKRLMASLQESKMFESFHSLIYKYIERFENKIEDLSKIKGFQEIFNAIKIRYSKPGFYECELKSSINLLKDNSEIVKIPISIKIWRKLREKGHIAIEFDNSSYQFNSFFLGKKICAKKNKQNLINVIKGLNKERLGPPYTSLIEKINIGQTAFPFENVKDAFFILRNTPKSAYKDIMKFRQQLKRQYRTINLNDYPKKQQKEIIKIREEMLKPYDLYYIPKRDLDTLTMNIVLNLTHLIDEYIRPKVIIERGSYALKTPEGSSALLYPVFYDVNLKINKVYKKKIPTKYILNEEVKEGFYEVFTTKSKRIEEMEDRGIKLVEVFNKHIRKRMNKILELRDNWDGEGSKTYNVETLKKAKSFLISLIQDFWMLYNLELDLPMIFPGIDGDIDIEWKNKKFQLLISIPEKDENLTGLYGSDYAEDEIELDFDSTKKNLRLLSWLKKQM
jgi:hypothetical protein